MIGSPRYMQSNVQVECAVRTIKGMLNKSNDPYLAVFSYVLHHIHGVEGVPLKSAWVGIIVPQFHGQSFY